MSSITLPDGFLDKVIRYIALEKPDPQSYVEIDYIDGGTRKKCEQATLSKTFPDGQKIFNVYAELPVSGQVSETFITRISPDMTEQEARKVVREKNQALGLADDSHDWDGPMRRSIPKPQGSPTP